MYVCVAIKDALVFVFNRIYANICVGNHLNICLSVYTLVRLSTGCNT